jgi:CheY-like chemotaxis protein
MVCFSSLLRCRRISRDSELVALFTIHPHPFCYYCVCCEFLALSNNNLGSSMVKAQEFLDEPTPFPLVRGDILVVDSDPVSRMTISSYLEDEGYRVIAEENDQAAWTQLEEHPEIDVIITDCPAAGGQGEEFLERLKEHKIYRSMPVIMHSATSNPALFYKIIQRGVFYFLSKPFAYEMLATLTHSAINRGRRQRALLKALQYQQVSQSYTRSLVMEYRTLEEADTIAFLLAYLTPDPERMIPGLIELLVNAVEHGNLEIGFELKGRLLKEGRIDQEIQERLRRLPYSARKVRVVYERDDKALSITITDEGEGFDVEWYKNLTEKNLTTPNGRGIAMVIAGECFDSLEYKENGKQVVCRVGL